nr:Cof-type HAD-IIB family hydrolase [Propionibacterium sp.]
MPRVILLDVDGTLVDYALRLPASAVDAIRAARARGHRVYLSTGRSRAEIYDDLWAIGVDGLIGANGGYVEDAGQVVLHRHLSAEQCRRVVDWLRGRGLEFYLESNAGLFGSEGFETAAEPAVRRYAGDHGDPHAATLQVRDVFPHMVFGADPYRDDVNKISYLLGSLDDHRDAQAAFPDLEAGTWGGRGAQALFGDLGVRGITKAGAIEALLAHLGADRSDTIAFGDARVVSMLQYCAVGVAMGNSSPDVLAIADHVTADVEHDGLAEAFRVLGLV